MINHPNRNRRPSKLIELPSGDIVDANLIATVELREWTNEVLPGGHPLELSPAVFIRLRDEGPGSAPSFRYDFATNDEAREFRQKVRDLLFPSTDK